MGWIKQRCVNNRMNWFSRYWMLLLFGLLAVSYSASGVSAVRFCEPNQTRDFSDDITTLLASACNEANNKHWVAALHYYQEVLRIVPNNQTAVRNRVFILSTLGMARMAEWQARQTPELFSTDDWLELKTNSAIISLRWGKIPLQDQNRRFSETDMAIQRLETLLEQLDLAQQSRDHWLRKRIRFDLIVALRDRWRMQEVLQHYQNIQVGNQDIPAYVLAAVADASLYLHKPWQARNLYRQALQQNAQPFEWKTGLFYALVDNEEIDQALIYIDQLNSEQPKQWRTRTDGTRPWKIKANPRKTETETLAAMARAYANNYSEAQHKLQRLLDLAPASQDIRNELATVYSWRGWFRKAEPLFKAGLAVEPKHLQLRIGHAHNLIALKRYHEAEQSIASLDKFSFYQETQKLFEHWRAENGYEFRQQTLTRNSSGAAKGSLSFSSDSVLFSKPLTYNYRVFVHYRWEHGDFPEGKATARREGAGLEYRNSDWLLSAEVHQTQFDINKIGFKLMGNYQLDDHWSVVAELDTPSVHTPLRALGSRVYARSVNAEINYQADENRQFSLSGHYLDFTDGNQRYELLLSGLQHWLLAPHWRLFVGGELFYSHNRKLDAPYFNPRQDVAIETTLGMAILSYRQDNTQFFQRISVNPGMYWQKTFNATVTGTLNYEHQWQFGRRFELVYGITGFSQVFDGDRENGIIGHLNFNLRVL